MGPNNGSRRLIPRWGNTRLARDRMAWALWRIRKKRREAGEGVILPVNPDTLLAWIKGNNDGAVMLDSWKVPGDYPMTISESPCVTFDGVNDKITGAGHGTVVSSEGTSTLSYDGTDLTGTAGTVYHVEFSDGTVWGLQESSGLVAYDSSGNGHHGSITTVDETALWAGTQDTFHPLVTKGFSRKLTVDGDTWGIDPVLSPDPVDMRLDTAGGEKWFLNGEMVSEGVFNSVPKSDLTVEFGVLDVDITNIYFHANQFTGFLDALADWRPTGSVYFNDNQFTTCTLTTMFPDSANLNYSTNAFDQDSVDNLLASADNGGQINGTFNISDGTNAAPSAAGLASKTNLEGKGWTVTVNI